jgi:RimJ/RimL family protein N-acetyltransferase
MKSQYKIAPSQIKDIKGRLIKIRAYEDSDYKGLKEMYDSFEEKGLEAGLPPVDKKIRHAWIDQMVSSLLNILALHRNRIIGHATLDIQGMAGDPEYLIFIKQGFRYCGIGTRLSEIIRDVARETGFKKVWLTVRTGNAIAIRVFKKVGFTFIGEIDIQREMELIIRRTRK